MRWLASLVVVFGLVCGPLAAAEGPEQKSAAAEKDMFWWQWANFIVLAGVLVWVSRRYGTPYFNSEAAAIRQGLEEARIRREEADRRTADVQRRLDHLDSEIDELRKQVLAERSAETERLSEKNRDEIARVFASAQQQIESVAKAARSGLQRHAADLAIGLASERVRQRLDSGHRHELVRAFAEKLQNGSHP